MFLTFILAAIIISRLFYIQVLNHKFYQAQALGQQIGLKGEEGQRGEIFFASSKEKGGSKVSGEVKSLAINKDKWLMYAVPQKIEDKDEFAEILSSKSAEIFGTEKQLTKEFIISKLKEADNYSVIKRDLEAEEINKFKKLTLGGLYFDNIPSRFYPQAKMAGHLAGFLGGIGQGQYGVEGYYDDVLEAKEGIKEGRKGLDLINFGSSREDLNGSDIFLTVDYNIQFQAESLLKQYHDEIGIDSGQIIVLNPDSGKILALANFPYFDPNKYYQESDFEIFQNSAIQKIFEPGSVFKPFTMAMALEEKKVNLDTIFNDSGSVKIGPNTIYNFDRKIYNQQTMSGILEKSINTGAVFLSKSVGQQTFWDYVNKFGFNSKTGVDLQGEVSSRNEILKNGSEFGFATASFGQGIEMTPLQLARSFCIFANGGRMVSPHIADKFVQSGKKSDFQNMIDNAVISQKTASEVTTMLINVVERGFGDLAKVKGYYLAGKTGTAQVPLKDRKGYYEDKTIQSFIGFGPALNPQFLILVKLDNPKVPQSSLSAAPIFKKLAQYIINYWQIPPDY